MMQYLWWVQGTAVQITNMHSSMLESVKQLGKLSSSSSAPLFLLLLSVWLALAWFQGIWNFGGLTQLWVLGTHLRKFHLAVMFLRSAGVLLGCGKCFLTLGTQQGRKLDFIAFSFTTLEIISALCLSCVCDFYKKCGCVEDILRLRGFLLVTRKHLKAKTHTTVNHHSSFMNPVEFKSLLKCHYGFKHLV